MHASREAWEGLFDYAYVGSRVAKLPCIKFSTEGRNMNNCTHDCDTILRFSRGKHFFTNFYIMLAKIGCIFTFQDLCWFVRKISSWGSATETLSILYVYFIYTHGTIKFILQRFLDRVIHLVHVSLQEGI